MKKLLLLLLLTFGFTGSTYAACTCKGYSGIGGPCYDGIGGPMYDGIGGAAYDAGNKASNVDETFADDGRTDAAGNVIYSYGFPYKETENE